MDANGDFFCKGTCYAYSEPLPAAEGATSAPSATSATSAPSATSSASSPPNSSSSKSPLVLFVSGLLLGASLPLPAQLLVEFLSGQLGFLEDVKASARISRAFFVGNSAKLPREPFQRIIQNPKEIESASQGVALLDALLSEVCFRAALPRRRSPSSRSRCCPAPPTRSPRWFRSSRCTPRCCRAARGSPRWSAGATRSSRAWRGAAWRRRRGRTCRTSCGRSQRRCRCWTRWR